MLIIHLLLLITVFTTIQEEFDSYLTTHHKSYSTPEEYSRRMQIYVHNTKKLQQIQQYSTHTVGTNFFSDLTTEERAKYMMATPGVFNDKDLLGYHNPINTATIGDYPNWVQMGKVTPVKTQSVCGDCFTFGATGSLESLYAIKNNLTTDIPLFSEQELTDCAVMYGSRGCNGGFQNVFKFVAQYGIHTAQDYGPFLGYATNCRILPNPTFKIKGIVGVRPFDNDGLLNALTLRPIWVTVNSNNDDFIGYKGGIYKNVACGVFPAHVMLLVGAGIENGVEYWTLKNSWTPFWGENGYMRIKKDKGFTVGICGINLHAAYPVTDDDTQIEYTLAE